MGYRNYIGSVSKEAYEQIKNLTKKQIFEIKKEDLEEGHVGVYDICENEIYEFGKYCEFGDDKFYSPVFLNKETQDYFTDEHDLYIVSKEFLKHIINFYEGKVKFHYSKLIEGITNTNIKNIPQEKALELYNHVKSNSSEWLCLEPYDLENGDAVTKSWKYEYAQFELVRIYKHFDWDNNIMIYYGY